MAERLSLKFLEMFCQRIQQIYSPGAHIRICSDGHVFSDLISVDDDVVDKYQKSIEDMVTSIGATHLSTYSLRDVSDFSLHGRDYNAQRKLLVKHYAKPEYEIKTELTSDEKGLHLYRNITRFLYEDSLFPGREESKTTLRKDAKRRAVSVVQRSWAWGNLLNAQFPSAIRLSIHPQPTDSIKIGIHMLPTKDDWLTPWHGVAANLNGNFVLMKNAEAQRLNGELVMVQGAPSHYVINT
ncbi:PvcA protein [Pseudomonas chlororaphis subsp. aurantiaca]|nr:PvcA protein [Pseudomonas chlororaphis subsp. aurantiaca]